MSNEELRKLGGRPDWEIDKANAEILACVKANTDRIAFLEKQVCENGRPSLENRMKAYAENLYVEGKRYADERDTHKSNSAAQALLQVIELMKSDRTRNEEDRKEDRERVDKLEKKNDERHESNVNRFTRMETRMAMALGAAGVVQVVLQHLWK